MEGGMFFKGLAHKTVVLASLKTSNWRLRKELMWQVRATASHLGGRVAFSLGNQCSLPLGS